MNHLIILSIKLVKLTHKVYTKTRQLVKDRILLNQELADIRELILICPHRYLTRQLSSIQSIVIIKLTHRPT
jgi:hypothetical protein